MNSGRDYARRQAATRALEHRGGRTRSNAAMASLARRASELGLDARAIAFAAGFAHWHRGGYGTDNPFNAGAEAALHMEWLRGFAAAHGRPASVGGTYASHTHPND